jgi:Ca2+-binding EF-hand superfamily protein
MKWALAILALCPAVLEAADAPSLLLPANEKTLRLQLAIRVDGQLPEKAHEVFLDRLFDFFDRDGDGVLNAQEAGRLFPLPGPEGHGIAMNFAKLDADGDGKGSRAEFKAFYIQAGFTPVVAVFAPAGAEMTRASATLFNRLDRDGDGKLSRAELQKAAAVLRTFDADEDETLTVAELLIGTPSTDDPSASAASVAWSTTPATQPPDGVLSVDLGKKSEPEIAGKAFDKVGDEIRFSRGILRAAISSSGPATRLQASREFYLAPFQSALGKKPFLDKKAIDDDSSLAFLAPFVPFADRDGDGRLTSAELNAFLDLIEAGVRSQIVVRIVDEGASLFAALDENHNGRLDLRELSRAVRLLPNGTESLSREDIPRRLSIEIEAGSAGKTFGPMLLIGKPTPTAVTSKARRTGPKWFQAMDRNGDGLLSPQEFLGPTEVFAKLDVDGDGLISVEEAERAKP